MDISEMGSLGKRIKHRMRTKIIFLTLFLLFWLAAYDQIFAQTVLFQESWSTIETLPIGWTESREGFSDWLVDDGSLTEISECNISGSSEGKYVAAMDMESGTHSLHYQYLNTTGYSNIRIKWNAYRIDATLPPVTFEWKTGEHDWTTADNFIDITQGDSWTSIAPFELPSEAENSPDLEFRITYQAQGGFAVYAIDDFVVEGTEASNVFYNISGALNELANWWDSPDGAGNHPTSFDADNQLFEIINTTGTSVETRTIASTWTVNGLGSKVQVKENIDFVIPESHAYNGTIDIASNAILTIQNDTLPVFGEISNGSTVVYNSSSPQPVYPTNYFNLTISGGGIKTIDRSPLLTIVNNNLHIEEGNILNLSILNRILRLQGTISGTGVISGNKLATVEIEGTGNFGTIYFSQESDAANSLRIFTINRTAGSVNLGSDLIISSGLTIDAGSLNVNSNTFTLNGSSISGNSPQLVTSASSNLIFGGSSTGVFIPASVAQLNNLTINNSTLSGISLRGNIALNGVVTVDGNRVLNMNEYSFTGAGSAVVNGTVNLSNTNGFTGAFQNTGSIALAPASTIVYNGANQAITSSPSPGYGNLALAGSGTKSAGSSTIEIQGSMTVSGTTLDPGTSSFIFTGSGESTLPNVGFHHLTMNGASTTTLGNDLSLTGNLTLDGGATLNTGARGVSIGGNWNNVDGSYNCGTGTVTFNKESGFSEIINEPSPFNHLTVSGEELRLASDIAVNGDLTIEEGSTFSIFDHELSLGGNFINQGAFQHDGGLVSFTGAGSLSGASAFVLPHVNIEGTLTAPVLLEVKGNWSNAGLFNHNNGTALFSGESPQEISGQTTFYNLTQDNNAQLTLAGNVHLLNTLKLQSGAFHANGLLTLVSNLQGTGRIAKVESGATFIGSITMERFVTSPAVGWHYIGTPIKEQTVLDWAENFKIQSPVNPGNPNVAFWNEPEEKWENIVSVEQVIQPGRGVKAYWWAPQVQDGQLKFDNAGEPVIGNYSIPVYKESESTFTGRNMIANPYPSEINWDSESGWLNKSIIKNTYYVWDPANRGYLAYVGAEDGTPGVGTGGLGPVIPSSQAFFVHALETGSLEVAEDIKADAGFNPTFFRERAAANELRVKMVNSSGKNDETIVRFLNHAAIEIDRYDAPKMKGELLNISSVPLKGVELAINSMPFDKSTSRISLKVQAASKGESQLQFSGLSTFSNTKQIYLLDRFTSDRVALNDGAVYSFNITSDPLSSGERFEIFFDDIIEISLADLKGKSGEVVEMPVKIKNFEDVKSIQFTLKWDETVIELVDITDFALNGLNTSSFNIAPGQCWFSWESEHTESLEDGNALFVIEYLLKGEKGTSTEVLFDASPVELRLTDAEAQVIGSFGENGKVTITDTKHIAGTIKTIDGKIIQNANVHLYSGHDLVKSLASADGLYQFDVDDGHSYTISVEGSEGNPNNGVSTIDISLIRRHILNIEKLNSPYRILGADVDNSGSVSAIDISWMRKIILGSERVFPNGNHWYFTPATVKYDSLFPFPLVTVKEISGITEDQNADFIGIRIGDVNQSWRSGSRVDVNNPLYVLVDSFDVREDEIIVPIKVRDFKNIAGYQFTITWNPEAVQFLDVENRETDGVFGFARLTEGVLTTSWDHSAGKSLNITDDGVLFRLKFKNRSAEIPKSIIDINSSVTHTLAFNESLVELPIEFLNKFEENSGTNEFRLYQNIPNPFSGGTRIGFYLPEADRVILKIYSMTGQELDRIERSFDRGDHFILWRPDAKNIGKGVYLYSLETSKDKDVKRLIIQE